MYNKLIFLLFWIICKGQKFKLEADLGLLLEKDEGLVLSNGGVRFKLQVRKPIPTFEFSGGCAFDVDELKDMAKKMGIESERYLDKTPGGSTVLNTLVTEAIIQKDRELTKEIRARFLGKISDKTPQSMDIREGVKTKGMQHCNGLIKCEFTHDLMPRTCDFNLPDECGSLYICCDKYHRDQSKCPQGAHDELVKYLDNEKASGRVSGQTSFCIRIVSAQKPMSKSKRSISQYWANGGIFNVLTGSYTDKMVHMEELERKNMDNNLQKGILDNEKSILRMNLEFTGLQTRLNSHICDLSKGLFKNIMHFEATTIYNELKIELDMDFRTCFEGFLPLSIPNEKLALICKDILGDKHEACIMSYSLFSCENEDLYLDHNNIIHVMKVYFSRPLEGFYATRLHTLPVPIDDKDSYLQLDMSSKIVFVNEKLTERIIFESCENRKTFGLCKLGSENQILADSCLDNILDNNSTGIQQNCKTEELSGPECTYRIIDGNVFLSSRIEVSVYKTEDTQIGFQKERLLQKAKGIFRIEEGLVSFNCGEIMYSNIRIPDIEVEEGSIKIDFDIKDLPVKPISFIEIDTQQTTERIHYETIGFYTFGLICTLGFFVLTYKRVKKWILIEKTARRIERLRQAITPRIEMVDAPRDRHAPSLVSMD